MNDILLSEIMTNLKPLEQYKMHFAKSDDTEPIDVYMYDFNQSQKWKPYSSRATRYFYYILYNQYQKNFTYSNITQEENHNGTR